MQDQLVELLSLISSGCMTDEDIRRVAAEAAEAYADPQAFLEANPDINYDETFPIPLGEWVVVGSLPDTVLFQADTYQELFQQIVDSFGPSVSSTRRDSHDGEALRYHGYERTDTNRFLSSPK